MNFCGALILSGTVSQISWYLSVCGSDPAEHTHLIQEDQEDAQWSYKLQNEHKNAKTVETQASVVGDLFPHDPAVQIPACEQHDEQSAQRKHPLGREVVKQIEQSHAADGIVRSDAQGKRAQHAQYQTDARDYVGGLLA